MPTCKLKQFQETMRVQPARNWLNKRAKNPGRFSISSIFTLVPFLATTNAKMSGMLSFPNATIHVKVWCAVFQIACNHIFSQPIRTAIPTLSLMHYK